MMQNIKIPFDREDFTRLASLTNIREELRQIYLIYNESEASANASGFSGIYLGQFDSFEKIDQVKYAHFEKIAYVTYNGKWKKQPYNDRPLISISQQELDDADYEIYIWKNLGRNRYTLRAQPYEYRRAPFPQFSGGGGKTRRLPRARRVRNRTYRKKY